MNRFRTFALAALVAVGPLAATSANAQQYNGRDRGHQAERNRDHDRNDRGRWNQRSHNGYYIGSRFYYGQPTYQQMQRRDYRGGYQQWRRGDRLPSYARQQYREVDWRRERLRQPPRGYHYVRDDRGELLLVAITTGVILSILLNN